MKEGEEYHGVVTGHNPSGYYAQVRLYNGKKASFRDTRNLSEGTSVKLKYIGQEEKGGKTYDVWKLVP